jgi:hypothetical protein
MDSSTLTGHGRPENTSYDRSRHEKMRLKPMGYGYFHINRTLAEPTICEGCGNEVSNPVRFINKKPYHKECFLNASH